MVSRKNCLWLMVVGIILVLASGACSNADSSLDRAPTDDEQDTDVVYFSSFESSEATADWSGYGSWSLSDDAAPEGGAKALQVSGGCDHPHVSFSVGPVSTDGYYTLRFWAKSPGGQVTLRLPTGEASDSISFNVADADWQLYQPTEALYVPAGSSLIVEMTSGGIVYSEMLIDLLQVVKVA